jgi:hypothetical protein
MIFFNNTVLTVCFFVAPLALCEGKKYPHILYHVTLGITLALIL